MPVRIQSTVAMAKKNEQSAPRSPRISNRRAKHEFHILEVVECGLALEGTEVKSLRAGSATLEDAFARIQGGDVYLVGANIAQYPQAAPGMQHDPKRDRRLLLHRRQIELLVGHVRQKGKTIVPIAIYFKKGWAKCELGVAIGKRQFDKREDIKARDHARDIQRAMSRRKRQDRD